MTALSFNQPPRSSKACNSSECAKLTRTSNELMSDSGLLEVFFIQESPPAAGNRRRRTARGIACLSAIHSWGWEGTLIQSRCGGGVPHPGLMESIPHWERWGYSPSGRMGVPCHQEVWGYPPFGNRIWLGYPPPSPGDRQTDACQIITSPRTSYADGNEIVSCFELNVTNSSF